MRTTPFGLPTLTALCVIAAGAALPSTARAQAPASTTCHQVVADKKLAGAAKQSSLQKCEREATERCEAVATERKLAGAAKTSNVNKCVREAVGAPAGS